MNSKTDTTAFRPKKRLGQHFLTDPGVIREIIAQGEFGRQDEILEIGPGRGALTLPLAGMVHRMFAVEKDTQLVEILQKGLSKAGASNVILINQDILKFDFGDLPQPSTGKIQVVGNLPYNISSPLIERLIMHRNLFGRALLMFQMELAERLLALPGHREYGAITVALRYYASVSPVLRVSRDAFYPRPKVDSMVLKLDFEDPHPRRADDETHFRRVVKEAFAHKRKTLANSLRAGMKARSGAEILEALERCNINPRKRAEALDIDDFISLSAALAR